MADRPIPIIVGVGDFKYPPVKPEKALEPYQLMLQAIQRAIQDTYLPEMAAKQLQAAIDSVDVVATWSWPYQDLPGLLSEKLGVDAAHKFISDHGGNQPAKLVDEAARRISLGKTKVAVVTGGEALASCMFACCVVNIADLLQWEVSRPQRRCRLGPSGMKPPNSYPSRIHQHWEKVSLFRCCHPRGSLSWRKTLAPLILLAFRSMCIHCTRIL